MGRTLATFTQLVQQEIDLWSRYRRALRREDQQALDVLFAAARHHASAGAYLARETPFEVMLLSMLIEQQKHVVTLQQKVMTLETRMHHDSTQGIASCCLSSTRGHGRLAPRRGRSPHQGYRSLRSDLLSGGSVVYPRASIPATPSCFLPYQHQRSGAIRTWRISSDPSAGSLDSCSCAVLVPHATTDPFLSRRAVLSRRCVAAAALLLRPGTLSSRPLRG